MPKRSGPSSTTRGKSPADLEALSFGQTFRTLRAERALSQTMIAHAIDRSTSFVSLIESDQRHPSRELIDTLADALGLSNESEDKAALLRAAGYDPAEISGMITRLVAIIGQRVTIGESQRLRLTADLTAQANGWLAHFEAQKDLVAGKFDDVKARCDTALEQQYLSSTLRTSILLTLADAQVHQGALAAAEISAEKAACGIGKNGIAPAWAPIATAESLALQGMIAIEQGRYERGEALLEQAIALSQRFLATTLGAHDDIVYIGIGSSYKRLAELSMLQGEPGSAFTYCLAAESYLLRARTSDERNRWLRRTAEQKAWAYTKLNEFTKAINLRKQTRAEMEQANDEYGLMRNQLYTGNDYLSQIKHAVRAAAWTSSHDDSSLDVLTRRLRAIQAALQEPSISQALVNAEDDYRAALTGLNRYGHQMLLALCLSNLATILRYKALINDKPQVSNQPKPSDEARNLLVLALTIENGLKQPRRIAAIYEALAELEIDRMVSLAQNSLQRPDDETRLEQWSHLDNAQISLRKGLSQLDEYLAAFASAAAEAQRKRMRETARSLYTWIDERVIKVTPQYREMSPGAYALTQAEEIWQSLCAELQETVRSLITAQEASSSVAPFAHSNREEKWVKRIGAVERLHGGRRILQNGLSDGLAEGTRAGLSAKSAWLHERRFTNFSNAVTRARMPSEQARDLCCREQVERDLRHTGTAGLTRAQIYQALDWMEHSPNGYRLESTSQTLPLAFYVKGPYILLEIPRDTAVKILGPQPQEHYSDDNICYSFRNLRFADKLRELFSRFVATAEQAREREPNNESTKNWLERLCKQLAQDEHPIADVNMWSDLLRAADG